MVSALVDVDAVEAAPSIERAMAAGLVDEFVTGDWYDVRASLGLLSDDDDYPVPPPGFADELAEWEEYRRSLLSAPQRSGPSKKEKAKKKAQKQARKKSRRR